MSSCGVVFLDVDDGGEVGDVERGRGGVTHS